MTQFKRIPALVEATRFSRTEPFPEGVRAVGKEPECLLKTNRGIWIWLEDGDWIIAHSDGRRSVCNDEEFRESYVQVEEA